MKRYKRFLLVAASLMLVLALVTVLGSKEVHAMVASMVQVVNNASNPVPNRDVDNPARQPYFFACAGSIADGNDVLVCTAKVPPGKRLVIENVSGLVQVPTGQKFLATAGVRAPAGIVPESLSPYSYGACPAVLQMSSGGSDFYQLNQTVRYYGDSSGGPDDVQISVFRNSNLGAASVDVNVTGYLISL